MSKFSRLLSLVISAIVRSNSSTLQWTQNLLNLFKMANFKMNFFTLNEFESPDLPGSGNKMDQEFLRKIDKAREIANIPFTINSGYRTQKHNLKVGGVFASSHNESWLYKIWNWQHIYSRGSGHRKITERDLDLLI